MPEPAWRKAKRTRCGTCLGRGKYRRGIPPYDVIECGRCKGTGRVAPFEPAGADQYVRPKP